RAAPHSTNRRPPIWARGEAERSERSEDEKHALSMFFAIPLPSTSGEIQHVGISGRSLKRAVRDDYFSTWLTSRTAPRAALVVMAA
ncbi:MAG: hypothetical protein J0H61_13545, partial [Alphaproteobacteria bacterium]|nr:hypothetical protein [Alphaproteobacteria bacterium]